MDLEEKAEKKKAKLKESKERVKERKKQLNRERVRRYRLKKREAGSAESLASLTPTPASDFRSRVQFKRALDKTKDSLPETPEKKAKILKSLISSPRTKALLSTDDGDSELVARAILNDVREVVTSVKHKRSDDARTAVNIGISMICGSNLANSKSQTKVASALGINRRRIALSLQHRRNACESTTLWTALQRKTRADATPEEERMKAHEFWYSPGIARPTGNKRDIARERIGPKNYMQHEKYVLEKTQTEVYQCFKQKYPNIKMGQRYFESCKPFFVIPARIKDRNSCCCRMHVETNMLFKSVMDYRRKHADTDEIKISSSLSELVSDTLCLLGDQDSSAYHDKCCIDRNCNKCGIKNLVLLEEEKEGHAGDTKVHWQRFEYVEMGDKRKLKIVNKETPVSELFSYFLKQVQLFPGHQFRASWQQKQMAELIKNLPENHVVAVHDYSENYSCQHQDQIQSLYFGQTQVSIHVTVLHRHAVPIDDEPPSSIVTEHLFVISPDTTHDSHAVHQNRELLARYLKEIGCNVHVLHEWTDGCSAQYKSRHCMGDVSCSYTDFGFITIRNYFETSHAKGPQDGAGANLKHHCDMAVIKRQVTIQDAKDLYDFADKEFRQPAPSRYQSQNVRLKRRIYFYVETVNRDRPTRLFREVEENRKIHSIASGTNKYDLSTRVISCYCGPCLNSQYTECENKSYVPTWLKVSMQPERFYGDQRVTRSTFEDQIVLIADLACKGSIVAIASGDSEEDYYLLKVTEDGPETLEKVTTDDWGSKYGPGAKVVRGRFLERAGNQQNDKLFVVNEDKESIVYAATVRFICQELQQIGNQYKVNLKQHEEILGSLNGF